MVDVLVLSHTEVKHITLLSPGSRSRYRAYNFQATDLTNGFVIYFTIFDIVSTWNVGQRLYVAEYQDGDGGYTLSSFAWINSIAAPSVATVQVLDFD